MPADPDELLAKAERARRDGNALATFDLARGAIAAGRTEARFRYLQVLASAQMGDTHRAQSLYELHGLGELTSDEDSLALRGRLFKDLALNSAAPEDRRRHFEEASEAYLRAYRVRHGYFPAINAATTAWAAGHRAEAEEFARVILAHPELSPPRDWYAAATQAEALVLLGWGDEALAAIETAMAAGPVGLGDRASACRQLAWLAPTTSLTADQQRRLLAALRPPPVITYTGHMFRPDPAVEAELTARIAAEIDSLGSTIAYGALASGADILFAEEILRRGGELHVVLPFGDEDFIRASVAPGGREWIPRFHNCFARASGVTLATRMEYVGYDSQFAYGSQLARGLSLLRAGQMATESVQLAVWDGLPARGGAGAGHDVGDWKSLGFETRIIDPGDMDRSMEWSDDIAPDLGVGRTTRAIIFTDYKGYSRLPESAIPTFNREVMGRIAAVLGRYGPAILSRNTWGDAFHGIIEDVASAAAITLDIIDALKGVHVAGLGAAGAEGMRIGLHFGPVYEETDLVTGRPNFYGSEVTLAARIEPAAIPGEVYTTQAFAAILAATAPDRFATRYLGKVELAKGYGVLPIYQLERRLAD